MRMRGVFRLVMIVSSFLCSIVGAEIPSELEPLVDEYFKNQGSAIVCYRTVGNVLEEVEVAVAELCSSVYDLNTADRLNGITFKGAIGVVGEAYRTRKVDSGAWSEWRPATSPRGLMKALSLNGTLLAIEKITLTVKNGKRTVHTKLLRRDLVWGRLNPVAPPVQGHLIRPRVPAKSHQDVSSRDTGPIKASVDPSRIRLGESSRLSIQILGDVGAELVIPDLPEMVLNYSGTSAGTIGAEGAEVSRRTEYYLITPQKAGIHTIPQIAVSIGNREYKTRLLTITVTPPPEYTEFAGD